MKCLNILLFAIQGTNAHTCYKNTLVLKTIIYLLLHHSLLHLKLTNHQLFINGIHKTINLKKQIFIVRLSYALKIICHSQLAWLVLPWCYETKGYY